jgi:hypothetical protein
MTKLKFGGVEFNISEPTALEIAALALVLVFVVIVLTFLR